MRDLRLLRFSGFSLIADPSSPFLGFNFGYIM